MFFSTFLSWITATVTPVTGARFLAQERQQSDAGYGTGRKELITHVRLLEGGFYLSYPKNDVEKNLQAYMA